MTKDQTPGPWIGWNGGECPVHPETIIQCVYHSGYDNEDACLSVKEAARFIWAYEVIAYRVIKEHKEPREWWIDTDTDRVWRSSFGSPVGAGKSWKYIRVREVMEDEE